MPDINGTASQKLHIRRGDTLTINAYNIGDLSAIDDAWFTIKRRPSDADTAAVLQVALTGGLLYVAGSAAADPLDGSLAVVGGGTTGQLTVEVEADQMALLSTAGIHDWDIQTLTGTAVATLVSGQAIIYGDATRSTT